jgi:predicted nucleotide-binding protein (sugar kinase/HSP70/actin superfamily)
MDITNKKVGIPKAFLYFKYHVFWKTLLKELGFDIVISPETNKEILKRGSSFAIDESCLSLKVFLGHVDYLIDKVDYVFIPRLVSLKKDENLCVKFMALGDIVRNTFQGVNVLEYTVDVNEGKYEIFEILKTFSKFKNPLVVLKAYLKAKKRQEEYEKIGFKTQEKLFNNDKLNILLVSHPYITEDALFGKPITNFLEKEGVDIIYAEKIDKNKYSDLYSKISEDLYWTYNKELLSGIEYYKNKVDGIIFLMAFPCGPDALVINLCQCKIKNLPIVVITIDDLDGDTGLKTRLESFVDILKMKKYAKK